MVPRIVPTALAAVGLVLLVVGLVMLTVAAPPQQVGGSAEADPLLVTAPGALALTGRAVEVQVEAEEAFVGLGRADEVSAWLQGVAATEVEGVATATTLLTRELTGAAPDAAVPPADPALADLWQVEEEGSTTLRLGSPSAEQVLVVTAPAGARTTFTWDRPARHPAAWPLVLAGALELVLGLLWLVVLNARRRRSVRRVRP